MPLKVLAFATYVAAFTMGAAFAHFAPRTWLLTAFMLALLIVVVLSAMSHRIPMPDGHRWKLAEVLVVILLAPFGPGGTEIREGPTPVLFIAAMLFTLGFVLALAMSAGGA